VTLPSHERRKSHTQYAFLRSQTQAILTLGFFTTGLLNGTKVYPWPAPSTAPAAPGSSGTPSTRSNRGQCSKPGTSCQQESRSVPTTRALNPGTARRITNRVGQLPPDSGCGYHAPRSANYTFIGTGPWVV
jgi:hypothetical protein